MLPDASLSDHDKTKQQQQYPKTEGGAFHAKTFPLRCFGQEEQSTLSRVPIFSLSGSSFLVRPFHGAAFKQIAWRFAIVQLREFVQRG